MPNDNSSSSRHLPHLIRAAGFAALAVALVIAVALFVDPAKPFAFDIAVLRGLRSAGDPAVPIGPHWLLSTMRDITALGGSTVLTLVVCVTIGMLLVSRKWLTASLVAAGTISGSLAVSSIKQLVARPRPEIVPHLVEVTSQSFPSGHSANSAIVYLTIATLLMQVTREEARRIYLFVVTAALVTLIGISRLYLGVHWPSDVLAGWSFGTFWALCWWQIGKWLRVHSARVPQLPGDEHEHF